MPYIKKLIMHGFKSFAKPTEISFEKGLNVIIGPNGSGKSNISEAICFVLGRLSAKSLRATKTANMIYNGGKEHKPAHEAEVGIVFDNSDGTFHLPADQVELTRTVKKDGTSVYKINKETKTRQEILETLASAAIDPEGFNIILQAEINSLIKMHPEERREIIEDIAGISIYETRKEKSLSELEKTEIRLKEIKTVLNERSGYLKNLEQEREQALKADSLKKGIIRDKASIIARQIKDKRKIVSKIDGEIDANKNDLEKIKIKIENYRLEISNTNQKIRDIEDRIEKQTGIEQESLRQTVVNLNSEIKVLQLKKENINDQINSIIKREDSLIQTIERTKQEIEDVEKKSKDNVSSSEKEKGKIINNEIQNLRNKIQELEIKKESYHIAKTDIVKKETRLNEINKNYISLKERLYEISKEIEMVERDIKRTKDFGIDHEVKSLKLEHQQSLDKRKSDHDLIKREIVALITKKDISKQNIEEILRINKCPTCKQDITKEHKENLNKELKQFIGAIEKEINSKNKSKEDVEKELQKIIEKINDFIEKEKNLDILNNLTKILEEKQQKFDKLKANEEIIIIETDGLRKDIEHSRKELINIENLDNIIDEHRLKIEKLKEDLMKIKTSGIDIHSIEKDIESEINVKKRDIEQSELNIKRGKKEKLELESKFREIIKELEQKTKEFDRKQREQEEIDKKFRSQIEEKTRLLQKVHETERTINEHQTKQISFESKINDLKIEKARFDAEVSTFELEFKQYDGIEIVIMPIEELEKRILKHEEDLERIGSVNMRALEVYDKVKIEYDEIATQVNKLEEEKIEILKLIEEIDKKKKRAFMQTFEVINEYFSSNFLALSNKGEAFIELQDKQDPFKAGLDIIIKLAKGKYMDAESLSGGEQTIVALALIFAIQRYKPYPFYIFDEIDAALDKRNSDRLSELIKKNIKTSQYIIISHNDYVINQAEILYGTSMQDGISKIVGIKL